MREEEGGVQKCHAGLWRKEYYVLTTIRVNFNAGKVSEMKRD